MWLDWTAAAVKLGVVGALKLLACVGVTELGPPRFAEDILVNDGASHDDQAISGFNDIALLFGKWRVRIARNPLLQRRTNHEVDARHIMPVWHLAGGAEADELYRNGRADVVSGRLSDVLGDQGGLYRLTDLKLTYSPNLSNNVRSAMLKGSLGNLSAPVRCDPSRSCVDDRSRQPEKPERVEPQLEAGVVGRDLSSFRTAHRRNMIALGIGVPAAILIGLLIGYLAAREDGLIERPRKRDERGSQHDANGRQN